MPFSSIVLRPVRLLRRSAPLVMVALALACAPPPDVPLFDLTHAGPQRVGVTTVTYVDAARDRSLVSEIWYPASAGGTPEYQEGLPANTFRDATPLNGRYPLVLFAHAMQSYRVQSYFLCARLASEGYVVVAPDFPGTTQDTWDPANLIPALTLQPQDLSFLLDVLPADALVGPRADFGRVAAIGHSLGAYTVLAAGAGHAKNGAVKDPRVRAVVALEAPAFNEPLGALPPSLMTSGTLDTVTPVANQNANYSSAASPKIRLTFQGGSHLAPASNWCSINDTPECNPPYLVSLDQYEAVNRFTLDFLHFALDGDLTARDRLAAGPGEYAAILQTASQGL